MIYEQCWSHKATLRAGYSEPVLEITYLLPIFGVRFLLQQDIFAWMPITTYPFMLLDWGDIYQLVNRSIESDCEGFLGVFQIKNETFLGSTIK